MESRRTFSLNLIFLLILNLLVKPFYLFGVEVGVQNEVGASEYGIYYAMFNFTFLFNVILDLGINNFQKIRMAQDEREGVQNMATLLPLKAWLGIIYLLVTVLTASILGFEGRYWFFIGWLMVNHILSTFLLMLRANLAGLHLFLRDSILSITDRVVLILAVGYALWFGANDFQIETFVLLQTGSYAMAVLMALLLTPRTSRWARPNFSMNAMVVMARKTWPFALLMLLMTAYNRLDGIMLERLAEDGPTEAGIYAQAYRILDAGNSFAFLYAGLLLPLFARMIHQDDWKGTRALTDQAARMLIAPAGVVCLLALFFGSDVMRLLYDQHTDESTVVLTWLMGSFVFIAVGYVFGTLVTASMNLQWLNRVAFFTVVLNAGLNLVLIPVMGAEGAAITSFVSLGFMALAQVVFCNRTFRVGWRNWAGRSVLLWSITAGALLLLNQLELEWWIRLGATSFIAVVSFLTLVVDLRKVKLPGLRN